jgi:predicted DNA-binding transcriptional regulator AlpA
MRKDARRDPKEHHPKTVEPVTAEPTRVGGEPPRKTRGGDNNIRLIRKAELAAELGVAIWTIDRWVRAGTFPKPIYLTDGAPARWRMRDVEAFLAKRQVSRRRVPAHRGALMRDARETVA